jgi:hypothetical protein
MINTIITHNGNMGELNHNKKFLEQLNNIISETKEDLKEEYYNQIITFYYSNEANLKYVYFTVCREDKVDGYILNVENSTLEEIALFIADKRNTKMDNVLDDLLN